MKKNDFLLAGAVGIYSFLFYDQGFGINFLLFSIFLTAVLLMRDKELLKKKTWLLAAAGSLISGACVAWYGNSLSFIANIVSLSALSAFSLNAQSSLVFGLIFSFYSYSSSLFFMFIDKLEKKQEAEISSPSTSVRKITLLIIPFLIALVFFFMYRGSNILFNDFAKKINLDFISWNWIAFTLAGFVLLYGFFYHRRISLFSDFDASAGNSISRENTNTISLFGKKLSIADENFSGISLFAMLNILLLIVNVLDFNFLFIDGKLPDELTYSEFVHQGTGMLITSILVAIGIILFYFRGPLNFYEKSGTIKLLAILWIGQNVLMLFSTVMRNEMYINQFGLTHKRIGVYVWLLLCTIGLLTTLVKIIRARSNMYLFRTNSWLFYAILLISCFFNWDGIISDFNLNRAGALDKMYLVNLSNTNLPQLYIYKKDTLHKHKEFQTNYNELSMSERRVIAMQYENDFDKQLNKKLFFFHNERYENGWRSWNYDGQRVENELKDLKVYDSVKELDLGYSRIENLAGLVHFTSLKTLNLYNNPLVSLEGIQHLQQLETLDVGLADITDFSPLYALKNLKVLRCTYLNAEQMKTIKSKLPNLIINP